MKEHSFMCEPNCSWSGSWSLDPSHLLLHVKINSLMSRRCFPNNLGSLTIILEITGLHM